jgi:hypothetical protein
VTASGARDHTFRLGVLASPRASPVGRANSRSVPVFPTRSPRSFLSRIFGNGSADSPPSIDELNGAAETELDPIVARDVRMQRLESRRRVRILRIALVAWRLDAYRAKKRRADVSVLFHHGDVRFTDCFDDGAGPAVEGHRSASAVMAAPSDVSAAGLTPEVWTEVCDPEDGHIATPIALLRAITGGVHPSLRKDCWKLLLRQYNFKHTRARRVERDAQVHSAYEALKMEWKLGALSDASSDAERLASFLEHCNTIDQDVSRSDFHDDGGDEFASGLRSVLRTYLLKPYLFSLCTVHCTALHCLCSLAFSSLLGWRVDTLQSFTLCLLCFFWGGSGTYFTISTAGIVKECLICSSLSSSSWKMRRVPTIASPTSWRGQVRGLIATQIMAWKCTSLWRSVLFNQCMLTLLIVSLRQVVICIRHGANSGVGFGCQSQVHVKAAVAHCVRRWRVVR